jgi:hypothetical protein
MAYLYRKNNVESGQIVSEYVKKSASGISILTAVLPR